MRTPRQVGPGTKIALVRQTRVKSNEGATDTVVRHDQPNAISSTAVVQDI